MLRMFAFILNYSFSMCVYQQIHLLFPFTYSYIIECVNAGALLPLKRVHLLGMSAETKKSFRGTVDVFGDR